jgi:hypothetical protein
MQQQQQSFTNYEAVHIPHFEIDFVQIALKQMTLHGPEAI